MSRRNPLNRFRFQPRVSELEDRSVPATLDLNGTTLVFTLDPGASAAMTGTATALVFDAGAGNAVLTNAGAQGIGFGVGGAQMTSAGDLTTVTALNIVGAGGTETFTISATGAGYPIFAVTPTVETTTLNTAAFETGANTQTYSGPVTLAANAGLSGSSITFSSTVNGAFNLGVTSTAASTFTGAVGGVAPLTGLTVNSDTLTAAAIATTGGVNVTNTGAGSITGIVSGAGALNKGGAGVLTLSGANTYTGAITVAAGTLVVTSPTALGTAAAGTIVAAGAVLNVRADIGAEPISIAGDGVGNNGALRTSTGFVGVVSGPITLTAAASIGNGSGTTGILEIKGVVGGAFPVTFVGNGTTLVRAANTYTGATTVSSGIVDVDGSIAAASAVSVTGGLLGGGGTVGAVTVSGGSITPSVVAPATPIIFHTGNTNFGAGTFAPFIAGTPGGGSGVLDVTGTVTLANTPLVVGRTGAPVAVGQKFTLLTNDGSDPIVGTFAGLSEGANVTVGGQRFTISYVGGSGNDIVLTAVPTPGALASALLISGQQTGAAVLFTPDAAGKYTAAASAGTLTPFAGSGFNVRTAAGDVNGDGVEDTIIVTGPGVPFRAAVVSGVDNSTVLVAPFDPFNDPNFKGGGFVAAADLDGDGKDEFIVTPDLEGGPRVSVFTRNTDGSTALKANFLGIEDPNFRGGARVAFGDVNGDGVTDIIVCAGFGGGPRTAIFNGTTAFTTPTRLINDFFAFPGTDATTLRNGVFVAAGDVDGDGKADLIFGGGPGGAPRVFILSGATVAAGDVAGAQEKAIANFFVADNKNDRGGVRLAVKDADGDVKADVIVGSGEGSPSKVRVYLGSNFSGPGEPTVFQDLDPFNAALAGGVYVG